ncbi:MAG: 4-hydroxy-tetrahydrodipicolinate synthase [Phycisphaerae bacterium]|jgi:4-hydroxy-tetrahydrodipicolinate synthase|nr:4-hydroxy-tetrahydrodipicolinate synthase [Phycisphaerae bacterium]
MAADFKGVFPALVTPMTDEQEVDYEALSSFVNHMIEEGGVHGVIPLGSTGEYYALSDQERLDVTAATIDAAAGRVPVLVGTNGGSTRQIIEYSQQAQSQGAAGLLLAAPYYSLPTPGELVEHFRAIDSEVDIPIMLYNYPGRTGVDMTPDVVGELADLDNVQYVKESTGDLTRVSEIIRRFGDKITVFCGCDTLALESFFMGASGWVSGFFNVLPTESVKLFELAVETNDLTAARELYYSILPVLGLLEGGGKYTQFVKAACGLMGRPVGPPRQPLAPPNADEVSQLTEALKPFSG